MVFSVGDKGCLYRVIDVLSCLGCEYIYIYIYSAENKSVFSSIFVLWRARSRFVRISFTSRVIFFYNDALFCWYFVMLGVYAACLVCVCVPCILQSSGNREHEVFLGSHAAHHAIGFYRDVSGYSPHSDTEFRCVCGRFCLLFFPKISEDIYCVFEFTTLLFVGY